MKDRKLYLCNRKRCRRCYRFCRHTSDIEYAVWPQKIASKIAKSIIAVLAPKNTDEI